MEFINTDDFQYLDRKPKVSGPGEMGRTVEAILHDGKADTVRLWRARPRIAGQP
jgi:hypothetical protein